MSAEVIFVGRVTSADWSMIYDHGDELFRFRLSVLEAFRGVEETEVDVFTSTSCGVYFELNQDYLVYGWRDSDTGRLETGACTLTNRAEWSTENIESLRGLIGGQGPSQVFGFATLEPRDIDLPSRASLPGVGARIVLESDGGRSWETVTDEEGEYEFRDLPGGTFEISAELPDAPARQKTRQFDLVAGGCSRQNFLATAAGRFAGRLVDSDGEPVPEVLVEIEAIPPTPQPRQPPWRSTDEDGGFNLQLLPAGEYVLGINLTSPPYKHDWSDRRVQISRIYFPGVSDLSEAQVLVLDGEQDVKGLVFQLPPAPDLIEFSGTVVLPDGPPARATVTLLDLGYPGEAAQVDTVPVHTIHHGSFSVIGVEGRPYALLAQSRRNGRLLHSGLLEIRDPPAKPLRVVLSNDVAPEECEICSRFQIRDSISW